MWCKSCGKELSDDIEEAIHDPEGEWVHKAVGIDTDGLGDQESHIKIIYRDTGPMPQCRETKSFTKVMDHPPGEGEGEGEEKEPQKEQANGNAKPPKPSPPSQKEVYKFDEDMTPMKILGQVITNPAYELAKEQIEEVKSWGEVYDGQIPPDQLEEILSSLSGVSKQRANLIRQKYEAMLNKWIREESNSSTGPSLGAAAGRIPSQPSGPPRPQGRSRQPAPTGGPPQTPQQPSPSGGGGGEEPKQPPKKEEKTRAEKREEMVDEAADQFAQEFAKNAADGAGLFIKDLREIGRTLFKKKAENDPEWFFEKMEKWDMDLFDEFMSMSDAKKTQQEQSSMETELEVDQALESVKSQENNTSPEPEPQPEKPQQEPQNRQEERDEDFSDIKNMLDEEKDPDDAPEPMEEQFDDETEALLNEMEE